ncbi:unnamed protein product [Polarella glacialis]|uniref:Uncharacterized protein n=1 Tax=Polarella glacialis TaxID=89957 RepID=A0A813H9S3_POLGL|nr:unnamed protein product [Polarella glacialis]
MSHRRALQAVADHPTADWGIILEDDIMGVTPNADEVVAEVIKGLPEDWDALFLGYHDGAGRLHSPMLLDEDSGAAADAIDLPPVKHLREAVYGLFAWVVRKEAAQALVDNAFPIGGQVDHALSSWLVHNRDRCYAVEPSSMVFFSPKSEEAEDSDIQSMATVDAVMERYKSWQGYYEHMWGLDAMIEEYVLGADDQDRLDLDWGDDELVPLSSLDMAMPPCEVPPPECLPNDYPEL